MNNLVGVYHGSKSDYEAWRAVLPMDTTTVIYTGVEWLSGKSSTSRMHIIQGLSPTANAKVYAYADRNGEKQPFIVFNGTKNYYINTYSYEGIKQIDTYVSVCLDLILDLFTDERLLVRIESNTSKRTTINTAVILSGIFLSLVTGFGIVEYKREQKRRIIIRINTKKLEKTILTSTFMFLSIMLVALFFKTYESLGFNPERYISIECLVFANCIFISLTTTLLCKDFVTS